MHFISATILSFNGLCIAFLRLWYWGAISKFSGVKIAYLQCPRCYVHKKLPLIVVPRL